MCAKELRLLSASTAFRQHREVDSLLYILPARHAEFRLPHLQHQSTHAVSRQSQERAGQKVCV
jgi:hypothetical protein